jgi:hypothetical protein
MLINVRSINEALNISSSDFIEVDYQEYQKPKRIHKFNNKVITSKQNVENSAVILEIKNETQVKYKKILPKRRECIDLIFSNDTIDNIIDILKIKQQEELEKLRQDNINNQLHKEKLAYKEEQVISEYIDKLLKDQKEYLKILEEYNV